MQCAFRHLPPGSDRQQDHERASLSPAVSVSPGLAHGRRVPCQNERFDQKGGSRRPCRYGRCIDRGGVPVKIFTDDVDQASIQQLAAVSRLPIVVGHVAAMPDVHLGIGATVGSVIPHPAGADPRRGRRRHRLRDERRAAHPRTPRGFPTRCVRFARRSRTRSRSASPAHAEPVADAGVLDALRPGLERILERHARIGKMVRNVHAKWPRQLGTLGGGNHFIEVCLDEADRVWVMLHSGSRGVGNVLGRYFTQLAKRDMERHLARLPAKDLAYLEEGSEHFADYVDAVRWAQRYALENRRLMMARILAALRGLLPPFQVDGTAVECHHNYVAEEEHFGEAVYVTRKGAIRAGRGELGIVPGSMGARSYIVSRTRVGGIAAVLRPWRRAADEPLAGQGPPTPRPIWSGRRPASSAARTPASSTRSRAPTRTSTR